MPSGESWRGGRLSARPAPESGGNRTVSSGLHLPLGHGRRSPLLFVPKFVLEPAPLVVLLHGAGGDAQNTLPILQEQAEAIGFPVLVPQSAGTTWDLLQRGYGPDVELISQALQAVFELFPVDPARVAISGFSDGGSYALSLGLGNGDLFSHVLAFSPGFVAPGERHGRPAVFISHGTEDRVLPIDHCGRRIATTLQAANYPLDYREFVGGHVVPAEMVRAAVEGLGWSSS